MNPDIYDGCAHIDAFLETNIPCPMPGKFLGIVGQDPRDSKSNWLHVNIFRF